MHIYLFFYIFSYNKCIYWIITTLFLDEGRAHHGEWHVNIDDTGDVTCELTCHHGYSIRGCHSITKDENGEWSHAIPTCEEGIIFFYQGMESRDQF